MREALDEVGRRIGRNTVYTLSGEVAARLLGAVYQVLLARHLGKQVFGEFSFAVALTAILGIAADLGLCRLVTREVARRPDDPWPAVVRAVAGRAALALLLGVLGVLVVAAAGRPRTVVALVAILAASQWIQGAAEILASAHRGRERMLRPAVVGVVCRLGLTLTGIGAIAAGAGVVVFAVLTATWTVPAVLLLLPGFPPRREASGGKPGVLGMLWRALPIGLGAILGVVSFRIGMVLLGFFRGDAETGLYAAPFRLVEVFLLLSGPLLTAVFPVLARRKGPAAAAFRGSVRLLAIVGMPVAVVLALEADGLLLLLFGTEFAGGAAALRLLAPTIPLSFLAAPHMYLLLSRDRDRSYAAVMGAGAALSVALSLALIPRLGHVGAAVAALATEAFVAAASLVVARPTGGRAALAGPLLRAGLAAGGLAGALVLGRAAGLGLLPRVAIGAAVAYPLLALATGALRVRDVRLLLPAVTTEGR